jgi:hypothetical protein
MELKNENDLQVLCNAYLRERDIMFYHKAKGRNISKSQSAGLPDLLIWNKGKSIFIELKDKDGKLSEKQVEWQEFAERSCIPFFVCRTFFEFLQALLKGGIITQ